MYRLLHIRNEETADQTLSKSFRRCACAGGAATLGTASPCGEAKTQRPEGSKALLDVFAILDASCTASATLQHTLFWLSSLGAHAALRALLALRFGHCSNHGVT